ncbi:MAG TPA: aminotransferase class III-fold pyridoxal phosphate-dependent enzyme [Solirubrobacterales bacterium]|nr:aminotransferase class III-fold pyridoxal phosphate-dependent enzyme [Solirubrobacterales bacterium]
MSELARHRVRHFLADFDELEKRYPGRYPRMITRGDGPYLFDDSGKRLLDAGNHLGAGMVGHGRREIADRMAAQAAELEFAALDSGVSHPKVTELGERLAALVPVDDPIFSFTSSGSESNDLAFKIARAYHDRRGEPERTVVLSRDGSYHGSNYSGMAATGAPAFSTGFGPLPAGFEHVGQPSPGRCPYCDRATGCTLACADALAAIVERITPERIAAVIAEPVAILQAVKVPHPGYWPRVQQICRSNGILLIADEVVTGFGRTGELFGSTHWDVRPDLLTMAKGLTSGYAPMGGLAVARHVEDAFDAPLLHLNTYAGHPVASEAALATLDILERESLVDRAAELEPLLRRELTRVGDATDRVLAVSVLGLLSSIEFDVAELDYGAGILIELRHQLYEQGLIARCALGDGVLTLVFYPHLVVSEEDIRFGADAIIAAIKALEALG